MKRFSHYLLFAFTILFSACSSDLEVIGNYKETIVVYGLLDQSQPKQYIKINKAFLGEGNALGYAQIKDSSQFVNSLNVVLKRIKDGTELSSITLSPDNTIPKQPGTFYGPDQQNAVYSCATPPGTLNTDSDYKLVIKNNETGVEVSSQTPLISDAVLTSPPSGSPFLSFINPNSNNYQYQVRWTTGKNARIYQLIIQLNYIDSTDSGNITQVLDWVFPEQKTLGLSGNESIKNDFLGQSIMQFIGNQLNDYSGLIARRVLNAKLILVAGGDDLNTFIEVNKPSTSIVQEKPEFTNITNGLGILSSRYTKPPFSRPLAAATWDSLSCGQFTKDLKFLNHLGLPCQ